MNIEEIKKELEHSSNPIAVLTEYLAFMDPEGELYEELIKEYNNLKNIK
jgi:hypothetical protein